MTPLNCPTPPAGTTASATRAGREVRVARERRTARRRGPEQDLILLQRRRLEHDRRAVRQRPFGDSRLGTNGGLHDRAGLRRRVHQRLTGRSVDVRLESLGGGRLDDRRQLRLIGQDDAGGIGRRDDDQPVLVGKPVAGEFVDLGERDAWHEAPVECQFLPDRRQRFVLEEIARVLVGAARRLAVGALGDAALEAEHHRLLRSRQLGRRRNRIARPAGARSRSRRDRA